MQPNASNGSKEPPKKDVAVYIDYENLYISLRSTVGKNPDFDVLIDKCREFGRLTICRAYADWSEFSRVVTSQLFSSGVEPIYVPTRKFYDAKTRSQATKNSVDIHITIDIMKDVLQAKNIDTFVLVSGDRDFVPLMNQIRAVGKEVYAIGIAGCTSSELAVAVDEMFYYHQLLETDEELANEQRDIYNKVVRAVEIARARGYRATLGVIKPIMREIVVGFDERKFRNSKGQPFQQFKQFVLEAERTGFIRVANIGEAVELFLVNERPAPPAPRRTDDRPAPRQRPAPAVEAEAPATTEAASSGEEEQESEQPGGGRRRGRRGGRGRRRGRGGMAVAGDGLPADESLDEAASDIADVDAGESDDDDESESESAGEERAERPSIPVPARREVRPVRAPRTEEVRPVRASSADEDDDDEDDLPDDDGEPLGELTLPDHAMEDLQLVMRTFEGRAPSQRRLIARLKKGAASGELKGDYRDGQFLLLVRKALQDGHLEKVSKGFYAGLRWKDGDEAPNVAQHGTALQ